MCRALKIRSDSYRRWKKFPVSFRKQETLKLKQEIKRVFMASKKIYGSPRVHQELKSEGFTASEKESQN